MPTGRIKGFTVVEMLVATVIAASLGMVVYTTFAQGVRLWTRAAKDHGEWKIDLWSEKMTENIRNTFQDPRWTFRGTRTELFFSALTRPKSGGGGQTLAYFRYAFNPKSREIVSRQYSFEDILKSKSETAPNVNVLKNIRSFDLEYYTFDPRLKAYRWQSQWNKDCFPETVKITIEPEQMNHRRWIRVIPVPTEKACTE